MFDDVFIHIEPLDSGFLVSFCRGLVVVERHGTTKQGLVALVSRVKRLVPRGYKYKTTGLMPSGKTVLSWSRK